MGEYLGDEAAPVASGVYTVGGVAAEGLLTPLGRQYLRETRPWLRFISIFVFVVVGLMVLVGGVMVLIGVVSAALPQATGAPEGFGAGAGLMGLLYLAIACLYLATGVALARYASALKRLEAAGDAASLEGALKCQKSFWRLVGIVTIAGILAMVLGLLIGMLVALLSPGPYRV